MLARHFLPEDGIHVDGIKTRQPKRIGVRPHPGAVGREPVDEPGLLARRDRLVVETPIGVGEGSHVGSEALAKHGGDLQNVLTNFVRLESIIRFVAVPMPADGVA